MRVLTKYLLTLILPVLLASTIQAQNSSSDETRDIQSMIANLKTDMAELEFLSSRIAEAEQIDHTVLVYRRDERSFRLLMDFDALVAKLAASNDESTTAEEIKAQLALLGEGVGDAIFTRIHEIEQRIIHSKAKLDGLSGGTLIAAQAYINSIETIRIKYYETLVSHLESRKSLGLPTDTLLERLAPKLNLYAESLAGRLVLLDATLQEVYARIALDPDNADNNVVVSDLEARHRTNVLRLEALILVFDNLGMDSSDYQAVMLQQSGNLSVSFLSVDAIVSFLKDSWA